MLSEGPQVIPHFRAIIDFTQLFNSDFTQLLMF